MIPADAIATLATIGLSSDQATAVAIMLRAVEDATRQEANSLIEARRANDRERKDRQRHGKSRDITGQHVTARDGAEVTPPAPPSLPLPAPPMIINSTPPSIPNPPSQTARRKPPPDVRDNARLFQRFYDVYPKHKEPKDALRLWLRVIKEGADPQQIFAAAERFAEAHNLAGTDKQFIPAPAVWLNKGGYLSEDLPAPVVQPYRGPPGHKPFTSQDAALLAKAVEIKATPEQREWRRKMGLDASI